MQILSERYLYANVLLTLTSARVPILSKIKRVARLETSACFRITRLRNNQIKSQRKATSQKEESDDKNAVAMVRKVAQMGCVSQHSDAFVSQGRSQGKTDAKSLGTNSKSTVHSVYATSSEYPGKERAIVGKNKCPNSSSAKSPRSEIRGHIP